MIRILGIDPGSVATGYGVIESDGVKSVHIAHGTVRNDGAPLIERLGKIYTALDKLIQQWQPAEAAIEEVFMSRNAASALKLGQARGAAICACVNNRLPVSEYAARLVKQSVVGTGAAKKEQIQHMIKVLLNYHREMAADAADALAVAICHGHSRLNKFDSQLPGHFASRFRNRNRRRRS